MEKALPEYPRDKPFLCSLAAVQVLAFIFFASCGTYHDASGACPDDTNCGLTHISEVGMKNTKWVGTVSTYYPQFQDVQVMVFFGLAFLYSFLRKHGFSSSGFNMMVGVLSIQIGIAAHVLVHALFEGESAEVTLGIDHLIIGEFAAATVLISWGGYLGRISPTQFIWLSVVEIIFYAINEYIVIYKFKAIDIGGSMVVHIFAAYFGLGVCWALGPPTEEEAEEEGSVYTSDIFSLAGTMFLWVFWPSFNSAFAEEAYFMKERAVVNTVLSLCASVVSTFFFSHLYHGRIDIVHIQNATLAGGVAAGTSCDIMMRPTAIILVGLFAGFLSTTGYSYISPWMKETLQIYDVAGINSLHGMPGLIGGFTAVFVLLTTTSKKYGDNKDTLIPWKDFEKQALYQFLSIILTFGFSFVTGVLSGLFIKQLPGKENQFCDEDEYLLPLNFSYLSGRKERRGSQVVIKQHDHDMVQMASTLMAGKFGQNKMNAKESTNNEASVTEKRKPEGKDFEEFDEPIAV